MAFAAVLIILRGTEPGPVALFGFNDLIIWFMPSVVVSGKAAMGFSLTTFIILMMLGWFR